MQDLTSAMPLDEMLDNLDRPLETKAAKPAGAPSAAELVASIDRQTSAIENLVIKSSGTTPAAPKKSRTPAEVRARIRSASALRELRETSARNDRRPDVILAEKERRINADLDRARDEAKGREIAELKSQLADLTRKMARPAGPTAQVRSSAISKGAAFAHYRKAMDHYLRTGEATFQGRDLKSIQDAVVKLSEKDFNVGVGPQGGFFVQPEDDTGPLEKLLLKYSPMRELATIRNISSGSFKRYVNVRGGGARWVGEKEASSEDATASFAELEFPAMTALGEPRVSMEALDDSSIDPEQLVAEEAMDQIAQKEGAAFVSGDGFKKPRGILGYDFVADASWEWGKVGFISTGADGAFHSTTPGDVIKDVPLALKKAFRQNASWLMNRSTIGGVRKMKDSNGVYLWSEGDMSKGIPASLDGYVVHEDEEMPDIATGSHSIAFGDWRSAYLIVDRVGFQVFRNAYKEYPMIIFHVRKRVGGGVQNFQAFKTIKFSS